MAAGLAYDFTDGAERATVAGPPPPPPGGALAAALGALAPAVRRAPLRPAIDCLHVYRELPGAAAVKPAALAARQILAQAAAGEAMRLAEQVGGGWFCCGCFC